ncbi:type II secretion system protein [Ruminococcus sp.]|uniref:type II secretion system protein n=1 Tax=Ruminococcus sp. TaxID=41978 RepID=UPI0025E5BFE8|nr:type II secretion system protein [Ruminococcus sp.]
MKTKKTKKGFTLIELIIVLAILGIVLAIMVPTWGYFITKSRERNANSRAKVIFGAAQTEITRLQAKERTLDNADRYITNGDFYFYSHGGNGEKLASANGDPVTEGMAPTDPQLRPTISSNASLSRAINHIAGNEGFYKIYVSNYLVQSVVYCNVENSRYKGTYPKTTDQLTNPTTIQRTAVEDVDENGMKDIQLP